MDRKGFGSDTSVRPIRVERGNTSPVIIGVETHPIASPTGPGSDSMPSRRVGARTSTSVRLQEDVSSPKPDPESLDARQAFPARPFNPQGHQSVMADEARPLVSEAEPDFLIELEEEDDSDSSSDEEGIDDGVDDDLGEGLEPPADTVVNLKRKYTYVSRTKGVNADSALKKKRRERAESLLSEDLASLQCCSRLQCFKNTTVPLLRGYICRVLVMSQVQRKEALTNMFNDVTGTFCFDGKSVCSTFLIRSFDFSSDLQRTVKGTPLAPRSATLQRDTSCVRRDEIICFLERLADATADLMPDTNEQHLPFFSKATVYERFVEDLLLSTGASARSPPSKSYFVRTWKLYLPRIKIRKNHRFTVCTTCDELRRELAKAGTNYAMASIFKGRKKVHDNAVKAERREYRKKCDQAERYPQQYCSLVVDGADQSAFGLPHFTHNTKNTTGHSLKVRLVGVLEHGPVKHLSLYTMTEEYETGANHVIEAIHRTLSVKASKCTLPNVLYVQLDNCTRENKNRYLFAYLESLVAWGVFAETYASFLPIGHTHSDIDQTFSCTSRRLRFNEAITMDDLVEELRQSYTPEPTVSEMKRLANFSNLCVMEKCLSGAKKFSQFRYFKFHRVSGFSGKGYSTGCCVRLGCKDAWMPLRGAGRGRGEVPPGFLKAAPDLLNTPNTQVRCPENFDEVTKRIVSEEGRINSTLKLKSLYELRDKVYSERSEPFHWEMESSFEGNGRFAFELGPHDYWATQEAPRRPVGRVTSRETQRLPSGHISSEESDIGIEAATEDAGAAMDCGTVDPDTDFSYIVNEFVAVRHTDPTPQCPFWIGRINNLHRNSNEKIVEITVHWHELYSGDNVYTGKYAPSYHKEGKNGKITRRNSYRSPWRDVIPVDSVLVTFEKMTTSRRLPSKVVSRIRENVGQLQ